jgi:putative endonuclease
VLLHIERLRTRRQAMSREWYLKRDRKFRKQLAQKL